MASRQGFLSTSVGTKLLIGVTGFLLFLYLLIHIGGNALIVFGPAVFNNYAYVMEQKNPVLPLIELALLAVFLIHVYKTVRMFLANQSTRPVRYAMKKPAGAPSRKTLASSTMIVSGLWLLVFIIIHVKAFRFSPEYEWPAGGRDLYRQELENLSNPLMVLFYILSMTVVGSHLYHGIASAVQSLGLDHPTWTPRVLFAGKVFAVIVAVGFMMIAAWVYLNQPGAGRVRV
jgi:succinate dehydrogenase / fumarate reductase cytochrome b subunit